jgi:phospholipid/cholesterol/gamma-HCH transport system substrate-binding protein
VDVGQVRDIDLADADPDRVRLVLSIRRGVPVKRDTVATLGVQGLTGIAHVELGGATRESPLLEAAPGEPYPVIRSGPSLLARLDTATTTLLADLDRTVLLIQDVLDAPTRAALKGTAADLARFSRALGRRSGEIDGAIAAASRAGGELPALVERVSRATASVERMADEMARAGGSARAAFEEIRRVAEGAAEGAEALRDSAPDLRRLVRDLRETTAALGRVAGQMERDPGALVLGRSTPAPGPGE